MLSLEALTVFVTQHFLGCIHTWPTGSFGARPVPPPPNWNPGYTHSSEVPPKLKPARSLGECSKLLQWGLVQSPSGIARVKK